MKGLWIAMVPFRYDPRGTWSRFAPPDSAETVLLRVATIEYPRGTPMLLACLCRGCYLDAVMRILSIEDHDGIRIALEILLELEGHAVVSVDRGEEAIRSLAAESADPFDLILLDLTTNGMSADEFLVELRGLESSGKIQRPPVCILSASSRIEEECQRLNAEFFIRKPFDPADLMETLERLQANDPRLKHAGAIQASAS